MRPDQRSGSEGLGVEGFFPFFFFLFPIPLFKAHEARGERVDAEDKKAGRKTGWESDTVQKRRKGLPRPGPGVDIVGYALVRTFSLVSRPEKC